jgi:hypothetical protein
MRLPVQSVMSKDPVRNTNLKVLLPPPTAIQRFFHILEPVNGTTPWVPISIIQHLEKEAFGGQNGLIGPIHDCGINNKHSVLRLSDVSGK